MWETSLVYTSIAIVSAVERRGRRGEGEGRERGGRGEGEGRERERGWERGKRIYH